MIKIHRLKQPNKHSGHPLEPGKTADIRGMVITNKNPFLVYVDKFTRKPWKPKKKAAAPKKAVKKAKPAAKKKPVTESAPGDLL